MELWKRRYNTDNNGNRELLYSYIVLHNAHPLKSDKPTVRIAIYNLSAHILPLEFNAKVTTISNIASKQAKKENWEGAKY